MTQPPVVPIVPALIQPEQDQAAGENGEIIGTSHAQADAARAGSDADLGHATRDSDGVPVGCGDVEEDIRRTREDAGED
jgi:hypothetical protein